MSQRDYKRAGSRPQKKKAPLPGWVWMSIGLVVGLFVAFLVYLQQVNTAKVSKPVAARPKATDTRSVKKETAQKPQKEKSGISFDFYDLLPEMEVAVPAEELARPEGSGGAKEQFLLQVGSFRSTEDAEGLKAQLFLLNFTPTIQMVSIDGNKTYHRVRVGPFDGRRELEKARHLLEENHIDSITLRVKPE